MNTENALGINGKNTNFITLTSMRKKKKLRVLYFCIRQKRYRCEKKKEKDRDREKEIRLSEREKPYNLTDKITKKKQKKDTREFAKSYNRVARSW